MKAPMIPPDTSFGVYLHIPYCQQMCHYCDFAKTANWTPQHSRQFFLQLEEHCRRWLRLLSERIPDFSIVSVNIGGGTPSLFYREFDQILGLLSPFLCSDCEISIEANPDDISPVSLKHLKSAGFNRMSVGVQSFQPDALRFLKRSHCADKAKEALQLAGAYFENLNADLIWAWPGQNETLWEQDLEICLQQPVRHLSLYNLTYAPGTPIGRSWQRGKIKALPELLQEQYYRKACELLQGLKWEHEEVSNWGLPGYSCRHNQLYWQGGYYLGIGPGAHGFLPSDNGLGLRYSCNPSEKRFRQTSPEDLTEIDQIYQKPPSEKQKDHTLLSVEARNKESWFLEYLGSSLRSQQGTNLERIYRTTGLLFKPDPYITECLDQGVLLLRDGVLLLPESEWFRETAWCLRLSSCFSAKQKNQAVPENHKN